MIASLPIERGPLTEGWATPAGVAAERFDVAEAYFAACLRLYPGLDLRGRAAFFIGAVSYAAVAVIAWHDLRGLPLPDLSGFATRMNEAADGLIYRLSPGPFTTRSPMAELQHALEPLIVRLKSETRLAERAQWRLVADSIAAAYHEVGREFGCDATARERALAHIAGGRAGNPQTGYHRLVMDGNERHYLKRGGCCRWYTADNGARCATCVLRRPDDQLAQLMGQC